MPMTAPAIAATKLFPIFHISASKVENTSIGNTDETVFCLSIFRPLLVLFPNHHISSFALRFSSFSFNLCGKSFTIFLALYFKRIKQKKRRLNYEQPKKQSKDRKKMRREMLLLHLPSAFSFARTHAHSHTLTLPAAHARMRRV